MALHYEMDGWMVCFLFSFQYDSKTKKSSSFISEAVIYIISEMQIDNQVCYKNTGDAHKE